MSKTVIIAVSDPNILYLLQRYAEESGFEAVSACQGKDLSALLAHQANPALIILDVELADTADKRLWRGLQVEAASRHVPVVVYSLLDDPAEEWPEGVAGYLPNSLMYDDFVSALKRAGVCLEPAWPG